MSRTDTDITPRYEFRAFGRCFGSSRERLRKFWRCESIEELEDIYLVAAGRLRYNIKIRQNRLSVKELLETRSATELWRPSLELDFPARADDVGAHVFRALELELPDLPQAEMEAGGFLDTVIVPSPQITLGTVFKRRFHFHAERCRVEMVELLVNGAAIHSLAVESEEVDEVLRMRDRLGLQDYENVSYLRAMQRIMGHGPPARHAWLVDGGKSDGGSD